MNVFIKLIKGKNKWLISAILLQIIIVTIFIKKYICIRLELTIRIPFKSFAKKKYKLLKQKFIKILLFIT